MAGLVAIEADAPQPDPGGAPTRDDAERAIAFGQFPSQGEAMVHILAALLRIEDQIGAAMAPAPTKRTSKE